jgi:hypothetical protein
VVADLTLKLVLESPLGVRYNASPFGSILSIIASYVRFLSLTYFLQMVQTLCWAIICEGTTAIRDASDT